ncbi:hypothetical protein FRC10_011959 [Ceratobasidium sp. 414]|nr:hypothetical protein FRC10_011959 [Ceratobasidium sp. 414]
MPLPAVTVNMLATTPALLEILFLHKLAKKRHAVIVNEAHSILIWSASGFRKDFEHVGDMRIFMPNPNSATLSSQVRDSTAHSLHSSQPFQH